MADLDAQSVVDEGTAPTFAAAAASDTAPVGSGRNTFVVYRNGSAGSVDVTVTAPGETEYGQDWPDPVISVAAGEEAWIPLRKAYDAGDGSGRAALAVSDETDVTVAVVRLG